MVIVFPSITPELYRRCAWVPVSSIIFPGLFISYLRRVDKCKGTCLYLIIGYVSFYVGGMLWMVADMSTVHTLPLAIISDVVTVLGVVFFANRRNELRTIWEGWIFDEEIMEGSTLAALEAGNNMKTEYL